MTEMNNNDGQRVQTLCSAGMPLHVVPVVDVTFLVESFPILPAC